MNNTFQKINMFFKTFFNLRKGSTVIKNPWAGLSSYDDPIKTNTPLKFCGREEESLDLFNLIDDNIIVTLYGKSGIGKTSLLNAGVFPLLRENNYTPLYVRLGADSFNNGTFASHISTIITKQIKKIYGENSIEIVDVVPENTNPESEEYLWNYFARRIFVDQEGNPIFPVVAFDQFEENIRLHRAQSTLLLKQIAYMSNRQNMLKDTYVDNQFYSYNYNFRFVISIREDDLFRLEDIISTNYLSPLRNGRYRLQNLSDESAKSIIQHVGEEFINPKDIDEITGLIINASKDPEDGFIRTNVISLICARLFDLKLKRGQDRISINDTRDYLSSDPFEEYYTIAIKSLSEGEKRFIESNLVSSDGRRNIIPEAYLRNSIRSTEPLINGDTPIFHRIHSTTGENLIELIHDGICPIVIKHRAIRLEKKNKTILSLCLLIVGLLGLWMLDTSVVNDFVSFFLTIKSDGVKSLKYINVLALTELLSISLMPIAICAIVYDDKRKKHIAMFAILFLIIPACLYPITVIHTLKQGLAQIVSNYTHGGIEDILVRFSNSTYVTIVYTICMLTLCIASIFGKRGVKTDRNFWINIWNSKSVKLYLWIIASFLYYRSIFNSGYFVIESFDSSWGLIIIPLLTLSIFGISLKGKKNIISFTVYCFLLIFLMSRSLLETFSSTTQIIAYLLIAFISTAILFYRKNMAVACYKSICNVLILAVVVILNMGYNSYMVPSRNVYKVYPWKIVVTEKNKLFGIYDAIYGDTLLIPYFQNDPTYPYNYYSNLPNNNYTDTITTPSICFNTYPVPLILDKNKTGDWTLRMMYSPNYESAISKIAHQVETDSINLSKKGGANLFIKLRNDISKFCFSGDESILMSDVVAINNYEEILKNDLNTALSILSAHDSIMTEDEIIPFIKSLSRSLYMNMLKEAILKGHYNDFISWFSGYYIATVMTSVTSDSRIKWSNKTNYNWNLSLSTDKNKDFSYTLTHCFSLSLEGLNNNKVYAWNDLYYALYLLECRAYLSHYSESIKKKIEDENQIIAKIQESQKNLLRKLLNYKNDLENQNVNLNNSIADLLDLISNNKNLSADDLTKTISLVSGINNISNKVKKGVSSEMNIFVQKMDSISKSSKDIALQQTDRQFKRIVISTFNSLIKIIEDNPINAYNGLLISMCQKLYVIGVMRGYNMEEYSSQISKIENYNNESMYNFVKKINNSFEKRSQLLDSLKKQLNVDKLLIGDILQ